MDIAERQVSISARSETNDQQESVGNLFLHCETKMLAGNGVIRTGSSESSDNARTPPTFTAASAPVYNLPMKVEDSSGKEYKTPKTEKDW